MNQKDVYDDISYLIDLQTPDNSPISPNHVGILAEIMLDSDAGKNYSKYLIKMFE